MRQASYLDAIIRRRKETGIGDNYGFRPEKHCSESSAA
jgi:hypothetical protein